MNRNQIESGRLYPLSMRVRWTRREDTVRDRTKEAGRSVSRFLVEAATREEGVPLRAPLTPAQIEELSALRYELRKIEINLNQLAHRENAADYGTADPPTDAEVSAALRAVRGLIVGVGMESSAASTSGVSGLFRSRSVLSKAGSALHSTTAAAASYGLKGSLTPGVDTRA